MNPSNDYSKKITYLLELADRTIATQYKLGYEIGVDSSLYREFRVSCLSFILNLYGANHPYYSEFNKYVDKESFYQVERGIGILKSIKNEIDNGWLATARGLLSAEIFTDFLEMADHLLEENYKDPAAVMIGSVLEEHLRHLCVKHGIAISDSENGKDVPRKADRLNSELAKKNVYNKLDLKNVLAWLDLRNKAAHGKYSEYNEGQVHVMMLGVSEFLSRHNL